MKKIIAALFACMMVSGCTTIPPLNFTPQNIQYSNAKIDAEVKSINVSVASEEEKTGDLMVGFGGNQYEESFRNSFKSSLEESLAASGIFIDNSNKKINIYAKVLKFTTPLIGINFPSDMEVKYRLQDRADGSFFYDKIIKSHGEVPGNYAFSGAVRFNEARNQCVRTNINNFLNELKQMAK